MPRIEADSLVTQSVLDRLIDREPLNSGDGSITRAQSVRLLKASLRRDLEGLLNTRRIAEELEGEHSELGGRLLLRAEVALNGLSPDDVDVEAVYGPVDTENSLTDITTRSLKPVEVTDGTARFEGDVPLERTGPFGYTVRVLPKNDLLATAAELGVVAVA